MKLAAIYNVFDGEELLAGSLRQIRSETDLIIAVVQRVGNQGEQYDGGWETCKQLQAQGLIDHIEYFEPKAISGLDNETSKRRIGMSIAKQEHCTHFLFVDCDEYYDTAEFQNAKKRIEEQGIEASVLSMYTYYKYPHWRISGLDTYHVPFIHRLHADTEPRNPDYPFKVDPTRSVNIREEVVEFSADFCVMHHFSWVRNDIARKMRNSSAKGYFDKHYKAFMKEYEQMKVGDPLLHWPEKRVEAVPNNFAIQLGNHLLNEQSVNLLIKFPTRGRTDKFFTVLDRYYELLEDPEKTKFIISCDTDDEQMNTLEVKARLATYKNLQVFFGDNHSKIQAVNADISADIDFDVLLLASDDMIPQVKGYDNIIRKHLFYYFPDTDGVLWYNDGYQEDRLNTLCILGKKYYNRFGYIYHPDYKSLWCDNEFMQVSKLLNKYQYFNQVIIAHEHPATNLIENDRLYLKNDAHYDVDRVVFERHQRQNFGFKKSKPSLVGRLRKLLKFKN